MSSKNTRDIEVKISKSNIRDQIAALLYATKMVDGNDEILDIDLGAVVKGLNQKGQSEDIVPVRFKLKRSKEVQTIKFNG